MVTPCFVIKFFHILTAILALGTSAGLGIVLECYGDHPNHGSFVLRAIERILWLIVVPGYGVMLVTGLWMVELAWPVATTRWVRAAIALWGLGLVLRVASALVLHRQIRLVDSHGPASAVYRHCSLLGRGLGAAGRLIVVPVLFLMVTKPPLTFLR